MTDEQREIENAKRRDRRRKIAAEKRANETEADRQAKLQRRLDAVIAANKRRTKAPEDRAQPKPREKKSPDLAAAIASSKRKPGRLLALSGWRGTGF